MELKEIKNIVKQFIPNENIIAFVKNKQGLINQTFVVSTGNKDILTNTEKDNLFFSGKAITLLQCIRFITDYLNNDSYYKIAYFDQNWIRAQNQWALYCSLKS